jgi:hypothetical protein
MEKGEQSVRVGEARALADIFDQSLGAMLTPPAVGEALNELDYAYSWTLETEGRLSSAVADFKNAKEYLAEKLEEVRPLLADVHDDAPSEGHPSHVRIESLIPGAENVLRKTPAEILQEALRPSRSGPGEGGDLDG